MKVRKSLLFILAILLIFGIISLIFPKEGITIGKKTFYFPSISDIFTLKEGHPTVFQRIRNMDGSLRMKQVQDSINLAYNDSLLFYVNFFENHPSRIYLPDNDWDYFKDLFEVIEDSKEKEEVIHILHYGDSQIEGDRITGNLRQKFQEKFGGMGPGLVPAVQIVPSFSFGQSSSENINHFIVTGTHLKLASHRRYGVMGQMGVISGESFISVASRNWSATFENVKEFSKIRLFVGRPAKDFRATMVIPRTEPVKGILSDSSSVVSVFSWELTEPIKKFTLKLHGSGEVYGIAVDGNRGLAIDNIPFRGSSGTFFTKIDSSLMSLMYKRLNTKMLILEFGGNVLPSISGKKGIADYKKKMASQIAYLKGICPEAKILLIGPSDMSKKVNGKLQTYPYLEEMVENMKETALENGVAFWNMFEVMGGRNSMIDWVKNKPSLAAPDHVHFTNRGADKIADMFFETWMVYYEYYQFQKLHNQKTKLPAK